MSSIFGFLLKLMSDEAYCDVTIRLRKGKLHGQIQVEQQYLEATLPQPDMADPKVQKLFSDTIGATLS